jgi:hypothetical protein
MELKELETKLSKMEIPAIDKLKHADLLAYATIRAKDKSVLSWWWLSIPLYIIAMLLMKSFFIHETTWKTIMKNFIEQQHYSSLLLFVIIPVFSILFNFISIRKIYYILGNPEFKQILHMVWLHIILIFVSFVLIVLYLII